MLGAVGRQHKQQIFRRQNAHYLALQGKQLGSTPEFFQVEWKEEVMRHHSAVQFDQTGIPLVVERHLTERPKIVRLASRGQVQAGPVTFREEKLLSGRQILGSEQQVEVVELTQG